MILVRERIDGRICGGVRKVEEILICYFFGVRGCCVFRFYVIEKETLFFLKRMLVILYFLDIERKRLGEFEGF